MKGLKLKDGKDNFKKFVKGHHLTFDEWIKNDFVIEFYHEELDFHYDTDFNWSKPFDYITKHLKDKFIYEKIGINTIGMMIEENYKEYMKNGDVSHENTWVMNIITHCWLKVQGFKLIKSIYENVGTKPSKELFEKSKDLVDIPIHIHKNKEGKYYMSCPIHRGGDFFDGITDDLPEDEVTIWKGKDMNVFSNTGHKEDEMNDLVEEIKLMEEVKKYEPTSKVGRNQPCPCGSGLKFKRCCKN